MTEETRETYTATVTKLLALVISVDDLSYAQRYELTKVLERTLEDWVDLKLMVDDLASPNETPDANP